MASDRDSAEVVGYVARCVDRPERLALFRPDGTVSNSFAVDDDRETVKALLAKGGLTLRDDDKVVRS